MEYIAALGNFEFSGDMIIFQGKEMAYDESRVGPSVGNLISDQQFNNGTISVSIEFEEFDIHHGAEIIVAYEVESKSMLTAGISGQSPNPFVIRLFNGSKWTYLAEAGVIDSIKINQKYDIKVDVLGSNVTLYVNNVKVCYAQILQPLKLYQSGLWALGYKQIKFSRHYISKGDAIAFVVMQFSTQYFEVYSEVIQSICQEFKIKALPISEVYSSGLIIEDITRLIKESFIVIAEITENNPNVFYELGYAHALNKPTILLAQKGTKLPFDVSPFRVLFYEDTIAGKRIFEENLRKHIKAITGF